MSPEAQEAQWRALEGIEKSTARYVVGIDECGTGAWAGPATVGVVVVERGWRPSSPFIRDSKQLTREQREKVLDLLQPPEIIEAWVEHIPPDEISRSFRDSIDRMFIKLAGLAQAQFPESIVVLDGSYLPPGRSGKWIAVTKGDSLVPACSAASILAKVTRDRLMIEYAAKYPGYAFERHVGYGTVKHQQALARLGPTPIHRMNRPVKKILYAKYK